MVDDRLNNLERVLSKANDVLRKSRCKFCGGLYGKKAMNDRYCSDKCRVKRYRMKSKERVKKLRKQRKLMNENDKNIDWV